MSEFGTTGKMFDSVGSFGLSSRCLRFSSFNAGTIHKIPSWGNDGCVDGDGDVICQSWHNCAVYF